MYRQVCPKDCDGDCDCDDNSWLKRIILGFIGLGIVTFVIFLIMYSVRLFSGVNTVTAHLGDNVTLNCSFDFPESKHQPFTVRWRKEDDVKVYLSNDTRRSDRSDRVYAVNGTSLLKITNATWEDDGWYKCEVFFLNQSVTASDKDEKEKENMTTSRVFLEVTTPKIRIEGLSGGRIDLHCNANNLPYHNIFTSSYKWTYDGKDFSSIPWLSNHALVTNDIDRTLIIHPTRANDSGLYACKIMHEKLKKFVPISQYSVNIENNTRNERKSVDHGHFEHSTWTTTRQSSRSHGTTQLVTHFNTLQSDLGIKTPSMSINATVGARINLPCKNSSKSVSTLTPSWSYQWTYKETNMPTNTWLSHRAYTNLNGSLTIYPAQVKDAGLYTCEYRSQQFAKFAPMIQYMLRVVNSTNVFGHG